MRINKRLKLLGDLVPFSSCPLDIGCDHALLSSYLVRKRDFKKVYASDNKYGPLEQAQKNLANFKITKEVNLILEDGLKAVNEKIDTITISGMGGIQITKMLEEGRERLTNIETLIISPNNFLYNVRRKLMILGYYIEDEIVVKENNIIYPVIVFKKGKVSYNRKDLFLGPVLKTKSDKLTKEYYHKEKLSREKLLTILPSSYLKKRIEVKREVKWLEKLS